MTPIYILAGQSNARELGREASFVKQILEKEPDAIIIESYQGGTRIYAHKTANDWFAENDNNASTGELFATLVSQIRTALETSPDSYIAGIAWVQGESDALDGFGSSYVELMGELYDRLGEIFADIPFASLALADSALAAYSSGYKPAEWAMVQRAQLEFAHNNELVALLDPDYIALENGIAPSEMFKDYVHYNDATLKILGNALADRLVAGDDTRNVTEATTVNIDAIEHSYFSLTGTSGDDELAGTVRHDSILGDDGNDLIKGDLGDDYLLGGKGNDSLYGGAQFDHLSGDAGNDVIYGETGNDTLLGGIGHDRLDAGDGEDLLHGDNGKDTLYGGAQNDSLFGGASNDKLYGGSGDDVIKGDVGNDIIYGDEGSDLLTGDAGADTLKGGDGDDVFSGGGGADSFVFDLASGADVIEDFETSKDVIFLSEIKNIADVQSEMDANGNLILSWDYQEEAQSLTLVGLTQEDFSSLSFVL